MSNRIIFNLEYIWRYSVNSGEYGGIVFASTKEEAVNKIKKMYRREDFIVWKMIDDDYFDQNNPDVLEAYGI